MADSPVLYVYYAPSNDDAYPGVPARHITEADWATFTIAQRRTIENATTQEGYTRRKVWVHRDLVDETEQERAEREAAEQAAREAYERGNSLVRYREIEKRVSEDVRIVRPGDDIAAIIAGGARNLLLEPGVYTLAAELVLPSNVRITGAGPNRTILRAAAGTDHQHVLYASGQDGIVLRDLTVDGNHANRTAALDAAYAADPLRGRVINIHLQNCTNAYLENVVSTGARGNGAVQGGSGVAVAITGSYARVINCIAIDNGILGKPSDGFFLAGNRMLVQGSVAENCTDNGFVLERCNFSTIADCASINTPGAVGVTATTPANARGNTVRGVTIYDWSASVTGGIQLLAAHGGSLYDTMVSDVTLIQSTPGLIGSAVMMRETGSGRIDRVTLANVQIHGAEDHGMNLRGRNITVIGGQIANVNTGGQGAACVRIDAASENVTVRGVDMVAGNANFVAVADNGAKNITFADCTMDGSGVATHGVYFFGTVTGAHVYWCDISGTKTANVGSDAGTTPAVIARDNTTVGTSGIMFGKERDTNLFRGAANTLQTNDAFAAPNLLVGSVALASRAGVYSGSGDPEGVVAARIGSLYLRIDGGAGTSLYIKESGAGLNTGWVAK